MTFATGRAVVDAGRGHMAVGMLRIQAAGTAGGGSAGRSGEGWISDHRMAGLLR